VPPGRKTKIALPGSFVYTRSCLEVLLIARKGMMVRTRLSIAVIIGLLSGGLASAMASAAPLTGFQALAPAQQTFAPTFTLPDHRGTPVSLAEMRGKVVVVRFWVTW
jgi:cytochrome oxidase Cu insertion factor (SCO1/SenC/PrrC family)